MMDKYAQSRETHRVGASIRELARRFWHSSKTILKALSERQPKPYTRVVPLIAPPFYTFPPIVYVIVVADQTAPGM